MQAEYLGPDLGRQPRPQLTVQCLQGAGSELNAFTGHSPCTSNKDTAENEIPDVSRQGPIEQDIDVISLPTVAYSSSAQRAISTARPNDDPEINIPHSSAYPPPPISDGARMNPTESQRREFRRKSNIHFAALCWSLFLLGWNDGTPGPLLPVIQRIYHVKFFFPLCSLAYYGSPGWIRRGILVFRP